jgi:hypothetical protein
MPISFRLAPVGVIETVSLGALSDDDVAEIEARLQ